MRCVSDCGAGGCLGGTWLVLIRYGGWQRLHGEGNKYGSFVPDCRLSFSLISCVTSDRAKWNCALPVESDGLSNHFAGNLYSTAALLSFSKIFQFFSLWLLYQIHSGHVMMRAARQPQAHCMVIPHVVHIVYLIAEIFNRTGLLGSSQTEISHTNPGCWIWNMEAIMKRVADKVSTCRWWEITGACPNLSKGSMD